MNPSLPGAPEYVTAVADRIKCERIPAGEFMMGSHFWKGLRASILGTVSVSPGHSTWEFTK